MDKDIDTELDNEMGKEMFMAMGIEIDNEMGKVNDMKWTMRGSISGKKAYKEFIMNTRFLIKHDDLSGFINQNCIF